MSRASHHANRVHRSPLRRVVRAAGPGVAGTLAVGRWTLMLALVGAVAGCTAQAPGLDALPLAEACACVGGTCPTNVCDVSVELEAATCGTVVEHVEVMLDDKLEPAIWVPGDTLRSCTAIARGAKATLVGRSDTGWAWDDEVQCPAAAAGETSGPTIVRVLHCVSGP